MTSRGRRSRRRALLVAGASALLGVASPSRVEAAPSAVALLAAQGTRLADELARELEASGFEVARVAVPSRAGEDDALSAAPAQLLRGVFVVPDDRRVTVFARLAPAGELQTRVELRVDPRDRLVRRRACLTVVELLRVMASAEASPAAPPEEQPTRAPPRAPSRAPAEPLVDVPAVPAVVSETAARAPAPLPGRPSSMGVAAELDLNTRLGESTGHFLFIWHHPVGPRLGVRVLALWPFLGATFQRNEDRVRMWTFGTAVGLQHTFVDATALVRPFLGLTLGTRLNLIETTALSTLDSESAFTPSVDVGLQAGIAFQISRFAQLFLESGARRDWLIPNVTRTGVAAAAANALAFDSSIGVMFDY